MSRRQSQSETCPYCKGQGYFQLIVGGTEDCPNCSGAGTPSQERIDPIALQSANKYY